MELLGRQTDSIRAMEKNMLVIMQGQNMLAKALERMEARLAAVGPPDAADDVKTPSHSSSHLLDRRSGIAAERVQCSQLTKDIESAVPDIDHVAGDAAPFSSLGEVDEHMNQPNVMERQACVDCTSEEVWAGALRRELGLTDIPRGMSQHRRQCFMANVANLFHDPLLMERNDATMETARGLRRSAQLWSDAIPTQPLFATMGAPAQLLL